MLPRGEDNRAVKPSFSESFRRSYWIWRRNPAVIVPTMLNSSLDVMRQAAAFLPLLFALQELLSKGFLKRIADRLSSMDFEGFIRELSRPEVMMILIPTALTIAAAVVLISIVGGGFVLSSEFGSYRRVIESEKVVVKDVFIELGRRWRKTSWTLLISGVITYAPIAAAIAYVLAIFSSGFELIGLLSGLFILLLASITTAVVSLFTVYVYPAVVFDELRGIGAVRESFKTTSRSFSPTLIYAASRILSLILIGLVALAAQYFGVSISTLLALILSFAIIPILHLTKTFIYYNSRAQTLTIQTSSVYQKIPLDLLDYTAYMILHKIRMGLIYLKSYLTDLRNLPYHLTSIFALILGLAIGNRFASGDLAEIIYSFGYQPGRINPELQGILPPFLGFDIFLHNWQVSISTALSGIGLLIPTFIMLVFNGFIIGVVSALTPSLALLLSAILPHGIIEVPSFLIAGSVGMKLGVTVIRALLRGKVTEDESVQKALIQAVYLIVGLALFFLIAGLIEGMITPSVMRLFGWH